MSRLEVAFEDDAFLGWDAQVEHADETSARGVLRGRTLDFDKEQPDRVVKAVTYHDLVVVEGKDGNPWSAQIVLDL